MLCLINGVKPRQMPFEMLKRDLQNAPLLNTIEVGLSIPVVLHTDVSENSISVTLSQLKEGDQKI